jgi:hypothetical protein
MSKSSVSVIVGWQIWQFVNIMLKFFVKGGVGGGALNLQLQPGIIDVNMI